MVRASSMPVSWNRSSRAHGSFIVIGNTVLGGTITSLDHSSSDGALVYENITGTSINAVQFIAATPAGKFASALSRADNLFGYSGDDILNGYADADHMTGGAGNDRYVVDSFFDLVTELANQGEDAVNTNLSSYTLGANVEDLYFTDTGPHTGNGNDLDNFFAGNSGKETLYGLGGDDYFNGYGGNDTFIGGIGDDSYVVRAGDTVVEQANEGIDFINTSVSTYALPDNVENLQVNGGGGPFYGNALDNRIAVNGGPGVTIYGLDGNDTLKSSGGSDTLIGGQGDDKLFAFYGHDTMTGGIDDDIFVIGIGNHVITDFGAGPGVHDRINLEDYKANSVQFGQNIFHNFSDVLAHTVQDGTDVVIDLGAGNSLTLKNIQKSALSADDFIWSQAPQDFNGDDRSDILWQNTNGTVSVWDSGKMSDAHIIASAGVVPSSWHIAGKGDFDGNGQDILWQNDNATVSIWDNGQIAGAHWISNPGVVPSSWHIAGTGDFDGNGQDDISGIHSVGIGALLESSRSRSRKTAFADSEPRCA
jgi:Ca2+-binding RTX toxin-like protein